MSRTKHHRTQKHCHDGEDWGAKYKCDKGYCGGTGKIPKQLANAERRNEDKKTVSNEIALDDSLLNVDTELSYDGYRGTASYNHKSQYWYGKIAGINDLVTYEATTFELLKEEFVIAVDDWQETRRFLDA